MDEVFPGRPDGGDLQVGIAQFAAQPGCGRGNVEPRQVRRVAELDGIVVDPQIDPPVGCACKDDLVMTGPTQLGSKEPARPGIAQVTR